MSQPQVSKIQLNSIFSLMFGKFFPLLGSSNLSDIVIRHIILNHESMWQYKKLSHLHIQNKCIIYVLFTDRCFDGLK